MRTQIFAAALFIYYNRHYLSKYSIKEYLKRIPYVNKKITAISSSLQESMDTKYQNIKSLPFTPTNLNEAIEKLDIVKSNQRIDRISGIVYHQDKEHYDDLFKVFEKYAFTNPLHPDIFPEVREMEIDIVQIVSELFSGDDKVCGNVTSGGTESILLACYTYREWGRKEWGITRPNIIAFNSVHPAFDKACHYFGIRLIKVSSLLWMKLFINPNTICVVGSAPTYGYGIVDPIKEISDYCLYRKVPLHVDCCMGGFLMPFLENNPVHFLNKGIVSISADTHKYGNSFKGSSVLLFKNFSYKKHQHFVKTDWEGGMYATPTILGSKSGALIATTWASLLRTGKNKYFFMATSIQKHLEKIKNSFKDNKDITIIGNPTVNIIAFSSKTLNIYQIVSKMEEWNLSVLTNPPAFHFCITSVHTEGTINKFIHDLQTAIMMSKANPNEKLGGTLAIYGSATKIENSMFTEDVVNEYVGLLSNKNV